MVQAFSAKLSLFTTHIVDGMRWIFVGTLMTITNSRFLRIIRYLMHGTMRRTYELHYVLATGPSGYSKI
jgi:hypothetical protein